MFRRVLHSLWVIVPALTLGWLAGAAFLYAGLRARKPSWTVAGVVYGVTGIAGFILLERDTLRGDIGLALSIGTLAIATGHALVIRSEFLRRIGVGRPGEAGSGLDVAEAIVEERRQALEIVEEDPLRAREMGIGNPAAPGGYHGHLVDLNHAPADAIARLPRLNAEIAARAVKLRDEVGGFATLEDAGEVLSLPPATVERLRGLAICLPY